MFEKETTGIMEKRVDLHHDNASAHNPLSVEEFLANKNKTVLEHQPDSPGLAPCDFYTVPVIKSEFTGTHLCL